ncbi:MAG: hypothetical protein UY75_C0002G0002 [Parcubacteria group bacterium GW2011_GWC2_52_8c]|nr:MAG: hypothetical protein UY75_C0002G0002 [Parcubacteria group bacterium GW2011_GWC2_52_8c]
MVTFEGPSLFIPKQETPDSEAPEREITPEQKEILESATKFAEYLTGRWPQIDAGRKPVVEIGGPEIAAELPELPESIETEQRMNYYLSGSLASMLISRAEKFTEIDETQIPALADARTREIPESARKLLASFARQIGDLDYVPADHYKANPNRLKKGGGGPSFNEVPEQGRKVLKLGEKQIKVMCDPVEAYGPRRVARVSVEGRDYYVARPDTILAYKALHLLQSYEQKPEKFNADFSKLRGALKAMYSEEELGQITQQVLSDYEDAMEGSHIRLNEGKENPPAYEKKIPKFIERVLANPQISPEIRATLEKLREQK